MTRPWRLTRRQRVEMEAVLAHVRRLDEAHSVYDAARLLGCDPSRSEMWPGYRVARARVAIALRAALRADEDARCEQALGRVHRAYSAADYERSEMRGAAEDWCDALREWPPLAYRRAGPPVPIVTMQPHLAAYEWARGYMAEPSLVRLALWEVVR